jgi:hypothetical protein
MFDFFKSKKADVIDHWYSLIPGFNASAKEFYEAVEKKLKECEVPGLEMFHVDFAEGGVLSGKREYLRMTRERLVFDICAAPFGTAYFFSCRFAEIPAVIQLWQLLVLLAAFGVCVPLSLVICAKIFGVLTPFVWPLGWIVLIVLAIYVLRNAVAMGLKDLDATLIKSPVVGPIYENWFRKETYYRQDTRLMYRDTVNDVVKAKVEEATGAKGIKLIKFNDYSPILGELYKHTTVQLPRIPPAV